MFKDKIASKFNVLKNELFVCDIWNSNICVEYRKRDALFDIHRQSVDIFVYFSRPPQEAISNYDDDYTRLQTYAIFFQSQNKFIGYPILVTFNLSVDFTSKQQVRNRIWQLIKGFINYPKEGSEHKHDKHGDDSDNKWFFKITAQWTHFGRDHNEELTSTDNKEIFNLDAENLKFVVIFVDPKYYKNELYVYENRRRDLSAPVLVDRSGTNGRDYYENVYPYPNVIPLEDCIHIGEYGELSIKDTLFCQKCNHYKFLQKKLNSWNWPNLFIVDILRVTIYVAELNHQEVNGDDIFVQFPIEGLNLKSHVHLDLDNSKQLKESNPIYDLYAISIDNGNFNNVCTM